MVTLLSVSAVVNAPLAQLDEAISKGAEAAALTPIGSEDFIFQGDMAEWIKFAKTLKLKILLYNYKYNSQLD